MKNINTSEDAINTLLSRGVSEIIDEDALRSQLQSGKRLRIKLGIDPTSPHIHIGRAVVLRKLKQFQDMGHTIVFIVGDFTGLIGDTSDKESERPMLSESEIKTNLKTYFSQAFTILKKSKTETYYNSAWLKKIRFKEIAEMADLFGLHEFEARENVKKRLDAGKRVSLRELLYPLMQGYDSVAVRADVELGGTDQKFNLLTGRKIQEAYEQAPQNILMTELLEGTDGRKMSSSWGNVINIVDSPEDMFGKVMSLSDDLIERYFILCTDVSRETIDAELAKGPRDAKFALAKEIVKTYHGERQAEKAQESFVSLFSDKKIPEDIEVISVSETEMSLCDLVFASGFVKSKSEARRMISQGGVKINDEKQTDEHAMIEIVDETVLQVGPRRFVKFVKK